MAKIFAEDIFLLFTVAIMLYIYGKNKNNRGGKEFGISTVAYGIFVSTYVIMEDSKAFLAVGAVSLIIIILSAISYMKKTALG